ncbi:uncharacterized protein LTR77_003474 [Saxophila tyrrhenica]|uniref:L-lactate dehydrogenase (cytochrome) n=1 Tax=Saxophila tyrrhenica TaxID=1690608 RepID=A0AAV9PGA2_9PEZI|nr:hypothetical protein LTR77_003474 [Saxophila tyrrhenica]
MEFQKLISTQEIKKHNHTQDCWIVIEDAVWDVTAFAPEHPGGANFLLKYGGHDATKGYSEYHSPSVVKDNLPLECFKGNLDRSTIDSSWAPVVAENAALKVEEGEKTPLSSIINAYDFEEAAQKHASKKTFAFYSTAATDCWSRDMNQEMYKRIWFRPRVMKDVTNIDTSTTMLGIPLAVPLFICPTGLAKMIHPDGEKALARAAKSTGILEILSTSASHPLPDILSEAPNHPFLFQLYMNKDRQKSASLIKQVSANPQIRAIFLTVDAAGRGKRESDERLAVDEIVINPVTGQRAETDKKGGGLTRMMGSYIDQSLTWEDIKWIRTLTDLPIVLKGITNAEDAKMAMQYGVEGIILSNHGGRNLDYAPPAILLLLEMHKCCPDVFERMEVFVDGGIRRGGDIVKAMCLGAKAVGIGRTFLYSLNYGTEGAEHLVEILKDEMESVMKLIGVKNLSEVHPGLVNTLDVDHLVPSTPDHPYAKWRPQPRL